MTPGALFIVGDRAKAYNATVKAIQEWIERETAADAAYPYSPHLAMQLYQWRRVLAERAPSDQERLEQLGRAAEWSERSIERSPTMAVYHQLHGEALWEMAEMEQDAALFRKSLDAYEKAVELFPSSREFLEQYGDKLITFGEALNQYFGKGEGDDEIRQGQEALDRAQGLRRREAAPQQEREHEESAEQPAPKAG